MPEALRYSAEPELALLETAVDREWRALQRAGVLLRRGGAVGLPAVVVRRLRRRDLLQLRAGNGLDPAASALLVAFVSAAGNEVARLLAGFAHDVWRNFVLPRLRRRFGEGAIVALDGDGEESEGEGGRGA